MSVESEYVDQRSNSPAVSDAQAKSAGGVAEARPVCQRAGSGASPTPALQSLRVSPVPLKIAKKMIVQHHYLHSLPGGTQMAFGVFIGARLLGAITLGVGSFNASSLVENA